MPTAASVDNVIQESIAASVAVQEAMLADRELVRGIEDAAEMILHALRKEGRLLLAGNGGGATCAQHIAAKLLGHPQTERRAIPAMALATNTSAATSISNDYGFDKVFAR